MGAPLPARTAHHRAEERALDTTRRTGAGGTGDSRNDRASEVLSFFDEFDIQMNVHFVAEHDAAGFERGIECHPEIAAFDGSGGLGSRSQISPGVLGFNPGALHVECDWLGDTPKGQISDDLPLILA